MHFINHLYFRFITCHSLETYGIKYNTEMKLSFEIEILKNCFHKLQSSTYDNVVRISNTNTGRSCTHRCVYIKISAHIGVRKFKHADSLIHWRSGQKLVKNSNKKKKKETSNHHHLDTFLMFLIIRAIMLR